MVIVQHLILVLLFHGMALWIILFWLSCMTCKSTEDLVHPSFSSCLFHRLQLSSHHPWRRKDVLGQSDVSGNMKGVSNMAHWLFKGKGDKNHSRYGIWAFCTSWLFPNIVFAPLPMLSPLPISALLFLSVESLLESSFDSCLLNHFLQNFSKAHTHKWLISL